MSGQDIQTIAASAQGTEALFTQSELMVVQPAGEFLHGLELVVPPVASWLFICILILSGFYAWIRMYYGHLLTQTLQATVNNQLALKTFQNNSQLQIQLDYILFVVYFFSTSLIVYYLELRFDLHPYKLYGARLWIFNLLVLSGFFLIRLLIAMLTGFVFKRLSLFREYLYNVFLFNKMIGVLFIPFLVLLFYTRGMTAQIVFISLLLLTGMTVIMRYARALTFSFRKGVSVLYMFLYLCALEIAPLLLLYRWLEGAMLT